MLEQSTGSVVQDSRLRRGVGQSTRSDVEVLQDGAIDTFELENKECLEVVLVIVGELIGTSSVPTSAGSTLWKETVLCWRGSETE